jgi:hypothetical protein
MLNSLSHRTSQRGPDENGDVRLEQYLVVEGTCASRGKPNLTELTKKGVRGWAIKASAARCPEADKGDPNVVRSVNAEEDGAAKWVCDASTGKEAGRR